jgi:hypothetical protein
MSTWPHGSAGPSAPRSHHGATYAPHRPNSGRWGVSSCSPPPRGYRATHAVPCSACHRFPRLTACSPSVHMSTRSTCAECFKMQPRKSGPMRDRERRTERHSARAHSSTLGYSPHAWPTPSAPHDMPTPIRPACHRADTGARNPGPGEGSPLLTPQRETAPRHPLPCGRQAHSQYPVTPWPPCCRVATANATPPYLGAYLQQRKSTNWGSGLMNNAELACIICVARRG